MSQSVRCEPGYASPAVAKKAPREKLPYTIAIYTGANIRKPDYFAPVDADPESATYGGVTRRKQGGVMVMIDCDVENGGMKINEGFTVDFGKEPNGPSWSHETRYPGGDCTSDIWL